MSINLPSGFEDLQPFADKWAHATEYERAAERRRSKPVELRAFYDAAVKRLPDILARIDRYPLDAVQGDDVHLFRMALSLAEVAPHIELYDSDPRVPFAFQEERLRGHHCNVAD
jgi:hypothetical protein